MAKIKGKNFEFMTTAANEEVCDMGPSNDSENFSDARGAFQERRRNEINNGLLETNGIPLSDKVDTEIGQQRPVLDHDHPSEFLVNTKTRGGIDVGRG